jgi:dihydrodipicolinate synthase/N-acetylneuraminate lyase
LTTKKFRGAMPALITPFDKRGEVDVGKLRDFVQWLQPRVQGFYVCGSYGSQPLMREDQCRLVAETVMKACQGKDTTVIVHVGHPSTDITIERARHAASIGAHGAASLTPYYYLHGAQLINDHFKALIDAVGRDIPVYLYNNPKYTNYCVTGEQVGELAAYGLRGLKDSSTSIQLFYNCIAAVKDPDFVFLVGSQTMLYPCLSAGGQGCVSGMSNLFPGLVNAIFAAAAAGDNRRAVALQQEANELRHLTGTGIPVAFYHAAIKYRWGIDIGVPRRPLKPLDAQAEARVRATLDRYPHLS